ncbi:MAG: T9SS type A sorting domain-containing protein [Fluviicola sp.]|nr:T9SS type A sorting domain-containing protein [Fluviicola sp.]MBP6271062.1 T9SS type A sorting domain-containing protein [Fluviicola sp.]
MKKLILTISVICFITNNLSAQSNCMVAHYKLDGNVIDETVNALNGINNGASVTSDRYGNPNGAFYFDGISDYLELPSDFDFYERTLSMWINVEEYPTTGIPNPGSYPFISDNSSLQYGVTGVYINRIAGVNQLMHLAGANLNYYTNAVTNTWYHVVLSISSSTIKYFLNGNLIGSVSRLNMLSSSTGYPYALVGCSRNIDRFFKGKIDDIRIYNCALSDLEINELYNLYLSNSENEEDNFTLFPNPTNSKLYLKTTSNFNTSNVEILIKDINGKVVVKDYFDLNNMNYIDLSELENGVYFVTLKNEEAVVEKKIIVNK